MTKKRVAFAAALMAAVLGLSGPAAAGNDPASDYARGICLNNGWVYLGFPNYLDCYRYYYSVYGTPEQDNDPFSPY